jgi:outer membrane protein TolC
VRREAFLAAEQSGRIGIAESELLPRLTLVGSVSFASGSFDAIDAMNSISPSGLAGKFGPTISWPILQFGRLKNNVRVQDARFQALLISYQNCVLRALREVEDAMIAFHKARERVISLQAGVNASQRAAELALMQYQNGLDDYTRVLNSELFLVQQQDKLTAGRSDVARSLIALYKALGGGWEIREGQSLLPSETRKTMTQRTDWGELLDEPTAGTSKRPGNPENAEAAGHVEKAR